MQGGLSYNSQYTMCQDLLSDADTTNLVLIKTLIGQGQTSLEAQLNIDFTVTTRDITLYTDSTDSDYRGYALPEDFRRMVEFYVDVDDVRYGGEQIYDEGLWQTLNQTTTVTSNYMQFYFIRGSSRIEIYPIPTSANTATMIYQSRTKKLSADDYTTGTITTLTNAAAAVTASGTTFTATMVGRYFMTDDMKWYKIKTFTDTTHIVLDSEYQGTSIAAGTSTFTIAEFPITPPDTHILPVYYACWKYSLFRKDRVMAREWEGMWKEGLANAQGDYASSNSSHIITNKPLNYRGGINPNLWPGGMT